MGWMCEVESGKSPSNDLYLGVLQVNFVQIKSKK